MSGSQVCSVWATTKRSEFAVGWTLSKETIDIPDRDLSTIPKILLAHKIMVNGWAMTGTLLVDSKLKPGTAGGPFSDLTDVLKSYALYRPAPQGDETMPWPYTQTFCRILRLILSNDIPKSIVPFLSANRFIALHKDPNDDSKL